MSHDHSALHILADRLGVLPSYLDQAGRETRVTSDETRVALLAAMGFDASTEERARAALELLDEQREDGALVVVAGRGGQPHIPHPPDSFAGGERPITLEDGSTIHSPDLSTLPLGYHTLHLPAGPRRLIVVPPRCVLPDERRFGLAANLYAVRSARNWGAGNVGDLEALLAWTARLGGDFVGINPLHAIRDVDGDISPYRPESRIFRNPLYIDIDAVPERRESESARALLDDPATRAEIEALRASPAVEYERAWTLARRVLHALHRTFAARVRDAGTPRGRDYARWVAEQGTALRDFATFRALESHFTLGGGAPPPFRDWPASYQHPDTPEVAAFREANAEAVDFERWLQYELDRQLGDAATRGRAAGLGIGIYQDLAIGCAPDGSDPWAFPDLFARGVSLGAPPDDYAPPGQNWGLPPVDPHRLRADGYAYFVRVVRAALRHSGAVRIDHVLGLFRQFWIPDGWSGRDGAYVRFPSEDLLGILALESVRHRAVIVGEDLGTVPPEVPGALERWGVLSTKVMIFEREPDGAFRPASSYAPVSLTSATTHDMVPLAGFWQGRDVELRREVGLLETEDDVQRAWSARDRDRAALVERLAAEGALEPGAATDGAALRDAVHRFLCRSPALLVAIGLDDLAGEVDPVNLPGIGLDRYPSWTRRMRVPLEALIDDPAIAAVLRCERGRRAAP